MIDRRILKSHVSTLALFLVAGLGDAAMPAYATSAGSCTQDASGNVTCSGGTITDTGAGSATTLPITLYDVAAQFQPTGGGNSYTPVSYNPNPNAPPLLVTIAASAQLTATITSTNIPTFLNDNSSKAPLAGTGLITANYSNSEQPVNNVQVQNYGSVSLINEQYATGRVGIFNSDSQVNNFVVNNNAGGSIVVMQTAFTATPTTPGTPTNPGSVSTFSATNLLNSASAATPTNPSTDTAKYSGNTLNITTAFYSDDNTNAYVVNNAVGASVTATGNYATAYYGRADTTITNSGTISNTTWTTGDTIAAGHWAIAAYAGTDYNTAPNTNPDSTIVIPNANGTVTINGTSALTLTNNSGATIKGDILALDITPLVYAAAVGNSPNPFPNATTQPALLSLPVSSSSAGPRDSNISNSGTIQGNLYLGSGTHVIDNATSGILQGSVYVDQRPFQASFKEPTPYPGGPAGTYVSAGGPDFNGNTCPAANASTTNPGCAKTTSNIATLVGGQSLTLTNEGTLSGDIRILDQATSTNNITLTGAGFTGNVVAVNGFGSNSLTLNGVTNLASVQNFTSLDLMSSNVTVTNGVSLIANTAVPNATLGATISGNGGTTAAPATATIGTINGALTLLGPTTVNPTITGEVRNGDVYQVASTVAGDTADLGVNSTALVTFTTDTSANKLLLDAAVGNASSIPGISTPAGQTLNALLGYTGSDPGVLALVGAVESLQTAGAVKAASSTLSPIVDGAATQAPLNATLLFGQQLDSRLDQFVYGQIPSSGRSADLGPSRPVPVYGVLPTNGAWAEAIGGGLSQSTVNGVAGYTAEFEGVVGGYDRLVAPGLRVGGAFGYLDTRVNGQTNFQTQQGIATYQGLVYADYTQDRYYVRGSVGYGGINYNSVRQITVGALTNTAFGSHTGNILTVRGEAGVPYQVASGLVIPYGAFTYGHLTQGAYTETGGGGAGFTFGAATNDSERGEIGGKLIVPLTNAPVFSAYFPAATSALALQGRAAYVHEFGDTGQSVTAAFAGGAPFVVSGPQPSRDMLDFGVGLGMGSGPVQIDLSYNGLYRTTFYEQYGLLRANYVF